MSPPVRKVVLVLHVASSVGWLGAVAAYLALAVVGDTGPDPVRVRAAYLSMDVLAWTVIVPASWLATLTGLVQSLGTPWGLLRHWWVIVKLGITLPCTGILLLHLPAIDRMAAVAATGELAAGALGPERLQLLIHATAALLALLGATVLSVVKPRGTTRWAG